MPNDLAAAILGLGDGAGRTQSEPNTEVLLLLHSAGLYRSTQEIMRATQAMGDAGLTAAQAQPIADFMVAVTAKQTSSIQVQPEAVGAKLEARLEAVGAKLEANLSSPQQQLLLHKAASYAAVW